jgi:Uncharacterised nucleotidyltransferase
MPVECQVALQNADRPLDLPGALSALLALVRRDSCFDVGSLPVGVVQKAIENGLGPLLAHVSRDAPPVTTEIAAEIQAADLTARVLTAEKFTTLNELIEAAGRAGCHPILLKGCAAAIRYYPETHLRTMGDIDLLVRPDEVYGLERAARDCGFREAEGSAPPSRYEGHHHRVPLRHLDTGVWVEFHTRPYPPKSPLAGDARFSHDAIGSLLSSVSINGQCVRVFGHELQLVYTSTRWAEHPSPQRGLFPILDTALLISVCGDDIDWERVCRIAGRTWAASAVRVMLGYLDRWKLAAVPERVMHELAGLDPYTNTILVEALHRFVTMFVVEGRAPGTIWTTRNVRTLWTTLVGPSGPATKLWTLPLNIVLPRGIRGRLDAGLAVRRAHALVRRVAARERSR